MDSLAAAQDKVLGRLERAGVQGECGPKLNEEKRSQLLAESAWFSKSQIGERETTG